MMSTGLPSTKPAIAAAVPVNEFSRLMTTGMSAPPIGSTIVIPKISAGEHDETEQGQGELAREREDASRPEDQGHGPGHGHQGDGHRHELAARDVDRLAAGSGPGACPPAMSEPVKVTDADERRRGRRRSSCRPRLPSRSRMKSSIATSAAAPPPTALNSDTSCGIAVIFTVRAVYSPAPPPMTKPITMIGQAAGRRGRRSPRHEVEERRHDRDGHAGRAQAGCRSRAVAGEFIRWRPSTKQAAPASQAR